MAAATPPKSGSNYDRGEERARAFGRVLDEWNPLQHARGRRPWRPLSNGTVSERIQEYLRRRYWPNDVQRTYNGERAMYHLTPRVVEAYCVALGRTSDDDLAKAFYAAELKPPDVTEEALLLAIATSRSAGRSHVA